MTAAAAEQPSPALKPEAFIGDGARRLRKRVRRSPSPASRWHQSAQAVDKGLMLYAKWNEPRCMRELARLRWGGHKMT